MSCYALSQRPQVMAAFENGQKPVASKAASNFPYHLRYPRVILFDQVERSKIIIPVSVEASRHEQHLRWEALPRRHPELAHSLPEQCPPRTRRQRYIDHPV